jgi:hypothetical protein
MVKVLLVLLLIFDRLFSAAKLSVSVEIPFDLALGRYLRTFAAIFYETCLRNIPVTYGTQEHRDHHAPEARS